MEFSAALGLVPYRLPELKKAIAAGRQVCIVEGEKDAGDNLVRLGFEATTGPMGAGKWSPQLCPHFTGARVSSFPTMTGWPRSRQAGRWSTRRPCRRGRCARAADLPEKADVSDWIAAGGNAKLLGQLIECSALPWADWLADQPVHKETEQETLARLAALSAFEYDRCGEPKRRP